MSGIFAHWPNRITAIRFVGALVLFTIFAWLAEVSATEIVDHRGVVAVAFWLFVTVAATDFLDGYLARRDQHITAFGRIACLDRGRLALGVHGSQRPVAC